MSAMATRLIQPSPPCAILNSEDVAWDEDRDLPALAVRHGLVQTIEAYDIDAVADHLQSQRGSYTRDDLIAALDHYIRHDAFKA